MSLSLHNKFCFINFFFICYNNTFDCIYFNSQQYGQSSAAANANANSQQFGPNGFGASQAGAGAQSFQSQGPLGGFGASSSNAQSQGFQAGPGGIQGNAGFSGGQSYNLPGGHNVALTYGSGYNVGPDGRPSVSNSNSLAYTK